MESLLHFGSSLPDSGLLLFIQRILPFIVYASEILTILSGSPIDPLYSILCQWVELCH